MNEAFEMNRKELKEHIDSGLPLDMETFAVATLALIFNVDNEPRLFKPEDLRELATKISGFNGYMRELNKK